MTERQEGIPVAPAEREHAKALHVRAADMVVDAGQQLYFLGAVAAEQRVVDDEDIPARSARQRRDGLLNDGCAQEQRELAPMDGAGVQEAVERIPLKRDGLWRILLPLVEGAPLEHRLERDEEDGHDRKSRAACRHCSSAGSGRHGTQQRIAESWKKRLHRSDDDVVQYS